MLKEDKDPEKIIRENDLIQITDSSEIEKVIDKILNSHKTEVQQFVKGKEKVVGFFIGQVMKETKGKANPKIVNETLRSKLESIKAG